MKRHFSAWLCLVMLGLVAKSGRAADHVDSPAATADPASDITDVYTWMNSDASKLIAVMNVNGFAGDDAMFSTAVTYVLHVNSSSAYGAAQTEAQVICKFYDVSKLECWAGSEYALGDPSAATGIASDSGKLRVFANLRDDPFFFELNGFKEAVKTVVAAAGSLTFDSESCPAVDAGTSAVLVGQLQHGTAGAAVSDTFAGANVLSIVVELDKSLVTAGGPIVGIWGSTHR